VREAAEKAAGAFKAAAAAEQAERDTWRLAVRRTDHARDAVTQADREAARLATRQVALDETVLRLAANRDEAAAQKAEAAAALAGLPDGAAGATALQGPRLEVAQARAELAEARAAAQSLSRESDLRDRRLAAIAADRTEWSTRQADGESRIATLRQRIENLR